MLSQWLETPKELEDRKAALMRETNRKPAWYDAYYESYMLPTLARKRFTEIEKVEVDRLNKHQREHKNWLAKGVESQKKKRVIGAKLHLEKIRLGKLEKELAESKRRPNNKAETEKLKKQVLAARKQYRENLKRSKPTKPKKKPRAPRKRKPRVKKI